MRGSAAARWLIAQGHDRAAGFARGALVLNWKAAAIVTDAVFLAGAAHTHELDVRANRHADRFVGIGTAEQSARGCVGQLHAAVHVEADDGSGQPSQDEC